MTPRLLLLLLLSACTNAPSATADTTTAVGWATGTHTLSTGEDIEVVEFFLDTIEHRLYCLPDAILLRTPDDYDDQPADQVRYRRARCSTYLVDAAALARGR